jgi:hypothetical protein
MSLELYMDWVKEVNFQAATVNKCLSCFNLNSDTMSGYYKEGFTPTLAVVKLTLDGRAKKICKCKEAGLKK